MAKWASLRKSRATSSCLLRQPPRRTSSFTLCANPPSKRQLSTILYSRFSAGGEAMYHYDAKIALEELQEDALLPHPVKLRDMILRTKLGPQDAQLLNHDFQDYLTRFGELQKIGRGILEKIAAGQRKTS